MKTFDVLKREEKIHRHSILEASAGTGKTFAIENIFSRLLIEEPKSASTVNEAPLTVEKILGLTFTKAAARDLKTRIRKKLESDCFFLKAFKKDLSITLENVPDYLLACVEKGEAAIDLSLKRIQAAIVNFDRAQIFTIHSFCWRMLCQYLVEANMSYNAASKEDESYKEDKEIQAIRDFLRLELKMPEYSSSQLKIIAATLNYDEEKLISSLLKEIEKGVSIAHSRSYGELFLAFQDSIRILKTQHHFDSERLKEDLYTISSKYKLHNAKKELKGEFARQIDLFSELFQKFKLEDGDFEKLISEGFILDAFSNENLRVKSLKADGKLHNPQCLELIEEYLKQIIFEARNSGVLFSRVIRDCGNFLHEFQSQEEMIGHSSLLKKMLEAIENPAFRNQVRAAFKAVIVDEFQDTDPIQWEIFSTLFAGKNGDEEKWNGYLTLVGDPKQSIYAFRQADIYTYLSAVKLLGQDALSTLMTNYRSHPNLIRALNCLFSAAKEIFPLPRVSSDLKFNEVMSPSDSIGDETPRLKFWSVETEKGSIKELELNYFFPEIASEIIKNCETGHSLNSFAILVADRYQAMRVSDYLKGLKIAIKPYKGKSLAQSQALLLMKELIAGVLNFESESLLKRTLAGKLIGMTHEELVLEDKQLKILCLFGSLRKVLMEQGFLPFISRFMESCFHDHKKTVLETLLERESFDEFFREWQDLCDLVVEEECSNYLCPKSIIAFLEKIETHKNPDEVRFQAFVDAAKEGVSVLTIHASKGLEFDNVFALGLVNRTQDSQGELIPVYQEGKLMLTPRVSPEDPHFLKHCEELDAEKLRLLYVAMTRAKYNLYVPYIKYSKQTAKTLGTLSPIELLVSRLALKSCVELRDSLYAFIDAHKELITWKVLQKNSLKLQLQKPENLSLEPPEALSIHYPEMSVESYASIAESMHGSSDLSPTTHIGAPPHDFNCENKTCHTLPSGNEIGILLHMLLELILKEGVKFSELKQLEEFIRPYISETAYDSWERVVAEMIFNALKFELPGLNFTFCLKDISPDKIYCETEFLVPYDEDFLEFGPDIRAEYLKGVIDLFFEHEGKYYIVDWKSNWLGADLLSYAPDKLEIAMKKNHYHLQASIYMHAMERFIALFDKRPFEKVFGGAYYIFLRGIGKGTGIFKN